MAEARSVVITGASRGLGFASATYLYNNGWRVVAAMRSPDVGLQRLRDATGAQADDPRLIGVQLDLMDPASIAWAAKAIGEAVGAPYAIVHNAGIMSAGMVEETPIELWEQLFATHVIGPVGLTKALLPAMRRAGRGRIVLISSLGGLQGMPNIAGYSAAKGAIERWGEAMAGEIAPFGLGVTILLAGMFDTDIITDTGISDYRDLDGDYGRQHAMIDRRVRATRPMADSPERFALSLAAALDDRAPLSRHAVGRGARPFLVAKRILPTAALHQVSRLALGQPRSGSLRSDAVSLTAGQRALLFLARIVPAPVLQRVTPLVMRFSRSRGASKPQGNSHDSHH